MARHKYQTVLTVTNQHNQYGFRKGYSTQNGLLYMLDKEKHAVDNGKLLKAFGCLSHELLIVKLHAYVFSFAALMHSYLKNKGLK